VLKLVPTGCKREQLPRRARVAILLVVVETICHRNLRCLGEFVPFVGGKAPIAGANMRLKNIGLHLGWRACLQILFAMVLAVGAP
jgi:hypothetical protein